MANQVAKLIIYGREIPLIQEVTTIGRAPSCQIVLDNDLTSRRHAQVVRQENGYWLRDLGSKNGTLLQRQIVTSEMQLTDGAEIQIGEVILQFIDPAAISAMPDMSTTTTTLWLDEQAREVWLLGEKLQPRLSAKQFDMLLYLYQRMGEVVSKDELAIAVWPEMGSEAVYDYQIDKMISRIRDRIGKEWIETVWGYGYRLQVG